MFNERIECTGQNLTYIVDYLLRITTHYTDTYASDMVCYINSIEEQLMQENFKVPHVWYFGFYKNGVVKTDNKEELTGSNARNYRAVYSYTLEIVENCGFKEPKITIVRISNN